MDSIISPEHESHTKANPAPRTEPVASPKPNPSESSSNRYDATIRLIRSRLADAARARAKPWWKLKP
jgi:hypothetical protein